MSKNVVHKEKKVIPNKITIKDILLITSVLLLIIALGFFAINQTLTYFYKAQFLQSPCGLCLKLNPNLTIVEKVNPIFPIEKLIIP